MTRSSELVCSAALAMRSRASCWRLSADSSWLISGVMARSFGDGCVENTHRKPLGRAAHAASLQEAAHG